MARLGGVASTIAGRAALDGVQRLARGERPELRDLLLTPANMRQLADQLARMRGAAMKVGQLVSMDTGEVLPPELTEILARLRADADYMPPKQLKSVLTAAWGPDWLRQFKRFDVRPIAAASIGQVHRALTRDGRDLAIKVQYPGVRQSIDSDVDNVAALIRWSRLLPKGLEIGPLLTEAKAQLHDEADYAREGARLMRFHDWLSNDPRFMVPRRHDDLTTRDVLAMDYVESQPIEVLESAPQADRDRVVTALLDLTLNELFAFREMQTDPNFANFRIAPDGRIVLLDFGASREIPERLSTSYRDLMLAGFAGRYGALDALALEIGFYGADTAPRHRDAILDMMRFAFGELQSRPVLDFADRRLSGEMQRRGMAMAEDGEFWHVPPADTLFVQRKLGGLYLLGAKLGGRVRLSDLLAPWQQDQISA